MSKDERILAVLDEAAPLTQGGVMVAARMDSGTTRMMLAMLEQQGKVTREIARTGKQGRPAYLYRRVRTEAA